MAAKARGGPRVPAIITPCDSGERVTQASQLLTHGRQALHICRHRQRLVRGLEQRRQQSEETYTYTHTHTHTQLSACT
jgi:hypothetical protein